MTKIQTSVAELAEAIREFVKPRKKIKVPELFIPMPYEWSKSPAWPEIRWLHIFQSKKDLWCVEIGTMQSAVSTRRTLSGIRMPQFVKSYSLTPEFFDSNAKIIQYVNEKRNLLQNELTLDVLANINNFLSALGGSVNHEARRLLEPPYYHGYAKRTVAP